MYSKGDEFRRVIIRPKDRISLKYAETYFQRCNLDGLTLALTGVFSTQAGALQGTSDIHYLKIGKH